MNIIDFENINVGYDEKIILKNLTLKIKEKEHWVILGANGSGKSTLMKLIQSEIHPRKTNEYKKEILGKSTYSIFELKKDLGIITNDLHNYFATHGNLIYLFRKYISTNMHGYISGIGLMILIMLMEVPLIYIIHNYIPWIMGVQKQRK